MTRWCPLAGEALELYSRALTLRPESALYSRAVNRAQHAMMGAAPAASAPSGLGSGFGGDSTLYARVDDKAVPVIDRYGCKSLAMSNSPNHRKVACTSRKFMIISMTLISIVINSKIHLL